MNSLKLWVAKVGGQCLTVLCKVKESFVSIYLYERQVCLQTTLIHLDYFYLLLHVQTTNRRASQGNKWHGSLHFFTFYVWTFYTHTDLYALSVYVCVPTILCLFVIKLAQACRARPPRAVTQTPSLLREKKKKERKVTSLNYIHPLGVSFCPKQTSEPPPPPTGRKPHRGLMERTFWWPEMEINLFSAARSYFHWG